MSDKEMYRYLCNLQKQEDLTWSILKILTSPYEALQLINIGFIECIGYDSRTMFNGAYPKDTDKILITDEGLNFIDDYQERLHSLSQQDEANKLSQEANLIAKEANKKSKISIGVSIIAIIVAAAVAIGVAIIQAMPK